MGGRRRVGQGDWTAASLLFDLRGGASSLGVSARTRSTGLKAPVCLREYETVTVCLGVRCSCFDGFPVKWARLAWWSSATRRSQTGLLRLRFCYQATSTVPPGNSRLDNGVATACPDGAGTFSILHTSWCPSRLGTLLVALSCEAKA
jgi:hypothetical protein